MSGSVVRRGNLSLDGTAGGTEARNAARVAPHKWPIFFAKPFRLHGVWVSWPAELADLIAAPGALSSDDIDRLARRLSARLRSR